jgi:hypothetical protein
VREAEVLLGGLGFAEGPRWHDGRLWFSDMGAARVMAVDLDGRAEVVLEVPTRPSGLGWLPDGRLLVVSMRDRRVLRLESDGEVVVHADLADLASFDCNDMVVDGLGRAYVGNAGFDLSARPLEVRAAEVVLVTPDGEARVVDDEVVFGRLDAGRGRDLRPMPDRLHDRRGRFADRSPDLRLVARHLPGRHLPRRRGRGVGGGRQRLGLPARA